MLPSRFFAGLFLFAVVLHNSLGQDEQRQRRREKHRRRLDELSRATTAFSAALYRQLAARQQTNVVFSPFSIYAALSMTLLGTYGETKMQLKNVLGLRPRQGVHRTLHAVFASLPRSNQGNVTVHLANALFYDSDQVKLSDAFTRGMRTHYGARPMAMQRPNAHVPINRWLSRATHGMIPEFLGDDLSPDTVIMLLNAVYFQGTWRDIFDERSTNEGDFTVGPGRTVRVPMMYQDGRYAVKPVGNGIDARVAELPYGTDGRFSAYIFLPDQPDGLRAMEARLSAQVLDDAVRNMPQPSRHMLTLPKFKLSKTSNLEDVLRGLGLTRFFSNADLTRMGTSQRGPLAVDKVTHKAVIEVNERGTKAAAVTGISVTAMSLPPSFRVKHPFLLLLHDNKAGIPLFMAKVTDPSQM